MLDREGTDGTGPGDATRSTGGTWPGEGTGSGAGTSGSGGTPLGPSGTTSTGGPPAVPMELIASMISRAVREGLGGPPPTTTPGGITPIPSTIPTSAAGGLHAGVVTAGLGGGNLSFLLLRQ
ncbi:PREDICTED: dirigent protein 10-like, partial [Amphimedon queenslandica]|uniref:Uncharacterized protein n=1 Tax=Amphimedon queenslandica TaxID=400682 RepID=A0AAN0ISU4_AMPQE